MGGSRLKCHCSKTRVKLSCQTFAAAACPHSLSHRARSVGLWCSWSESLRQPTCSTDSTDTKMCKSGPPTSKDETITNGLSLEGVHVGTVNLMISSGTVILILCAVFFYFYCKGRRGFCGPPATSTSSLAAPAMGFQQPMVMPGYFPHYPPPPYSMSQTLQPSHAVAIPSTHQASAPAAEASLPSSPAEPASPAPGSLSFRQLEARVDTLFSIANSASDVVVACRGVIDETQH